MRHATQVRVGVSDMARLMTDSDLAIGAAGSTSWERCALGLPSILLVLAENQRSLAEGLHRQGAAIAVSSAGEAVAFMEQHLRGGTLAGLLQSLSAGAAGVVDGHGVSRVLHDMTHHG